MKLAIVLFNLGGPDSPEAVEPFLRNLFSDPAIISLPAIVRKPLARFIARRRAPLARKIYDHMGGRSPILEETQAQARALEAALSGAGPGSQGVGGDALLASVQRWRGGGGARFAPDQIVLLPLYPQFSTTTTCVFLQGLGAGGAQGRAYGAHDADLLLSGQCGFHRRGGGKNPRGDGKSEAWPFLSFAVVGAWPAQTDD